MTRVVFVGEMYNADLQVGGGPMPGGGGPVDPGYSPPWARPQPPVIAGGPGWLPRPPGPVDPGYSPPWARPPVDPGWGVTPPVDPSWGVRPPVDPGYSPPWARPQPPYVDNALPQPPLGIWGGGNVPMPTPPIYLPPQAAVIDPVDPNKMYLVAYVPNSDGTKVERITFTVDKPAPSEPPTEATPKV